MIIGDALTVATGGAVLDKLWVNPSPEATFPASDITISGVNDYQFLMITFDLAKGTSAPTGEEAIVVPTDGLAYQVSFVRYATGYICLRTARVDTGSVHFNDASLGSASSYATNNSYLIPLTIWGIR